MSIRYTPSHLARVAEHARLITSPEARLVGTTHPDPLVRDMYQSAVVDSSLAGFKHMAPRYGKKGQLPGYELVSDDPMPMSDLEKVRMQLAEMGAHRQSSGIESAPALSPEDQAILLKAIHGEVDPGSIKKVGGLGVDGRRYPEGHERAGKSIPVSTLITPAERVPRAEKLFVDVAGMVDPVSGAQLTGNSLDAMHKEDLASSILGGKPELIAAISNIYAGPNSLNQADGKRQGQALADSRTKRYHRLLGEEHELETGSPVTGNADKYSRSDDKVLKELGKDALVREHQYNLAVEKAANKILSALRAEGPKRAAGSRMSELPAVVTADMIRKSAVAGDRVYR